MTPGSVVLRLEVGAASEAVDLTDASLYERLAERFGVQVAVADQWVSAIRLSDGEARLLGVPPDQPAILFQRVTRDPGGAVVEYSRSLFRGDRYEVHTRHRRPGVAAPEPPRREVPEALPRRGHVGCRSGQGAFV